MVYVALLGIIIFISMFVNGYQLIKHNDIKNQIEDIEKEINLIKNGRKN